MSGKIGAAFGPPLPFLSRFRARSARTSAPCALGLGLGLLRVAVSVHRAQVAGVVVQPPGCIPRVVDVVDLMSDTREQPGAAGLALTQPAVALHDLIAQPAPGPTAAALAVCGRLRLMPGRRHHSLQFSGASWHQCSSCTRIAVARLAWATAKDNSPSVTRTKKPPQEGGHQLRSDRSAQLAAPLDSMGGVLRLRFNTDNLCRHDVSPPFLRIDTQVHLGPIECGVLKKLNLRPF